MSHTDFLVRKDALATTELRTVEDAALPDGQVRVRIERFALTANNITYAAFGEAMNYWGFYPAPDGWGRIPVWGFGSVVQSSHSGVAVGERLYGYWPMASSVVLTPTRLSEASLSDGATHRQALHSVYNQYLRCASDPFYRVASEDLQALLRPLFITSWLIDDFFADNAFFGANTLLLSSASSKTASGTAFMLAQRSGLEVVGLTSAANKAFCESLGCYSRVLSYDELGALPAESSCAYIDFAGNAALRMQVHQRFSAMRYSCSVGGAHVAQLGGARELPGPKATLFFAPAQIKKRSAEWGPAELGQRLLASWQAFTQRVQNPAAPWLLVQQHQGPQSLQSIYAQVLAGGGDPRHGHMVSL